MAACCNTTHPDAEWPIMCHHRFVIYGVLFVLLVISFAWNIFCCASKCCSGRKTCRQDKSQSQRKIKENPIYGNISFSQINVTCTEIDPLNSSVSSSSLRDQQRVNTDSQDCYANLTLKAPRPQSGPSSPQIQYSEVVQLVEPLASEKDANNTDTMSNISDLYASVQTQRTKTVDTADGGEGYANHI